MNYILAIDQGTTSSRVFIYNQNFEIVAIGQKSFQQYFPKPGLVEHDADEIWASVMGSLSDCLANVRDPNFTVNKIASIGITNQRETFLLWDKRNNKPLAKAIVWQDRRSADFCKSLQKSAIGKKIIQSTGLVLDPYFSGTKLSLLLKEVKATDNVAFGNIDTFFIMATHKR